MSTSMLQQVSANKYLAQYGEFKYSIRNEKGRSLISFDARDVKQLSSNLLLVQKHYHKKLSLFSIHALNFISLPIYDSFRLYGRYVIFERSGGFGVGAVGETNFFELEGPSFDRIIAICDGNVLYQNGDNYGVKNLFNKRDFSSKYPINVNQHGCYFIMTPQGEVDIRTYFNIGEVQQPSVIKEIQRVSDGYIGRSFVPDEEVSLYRVNFGRDRGILGGYGYLLKESSSDRVIIPFDYSDAKVKQNFISFYNEETNQTILVYPSLGIEVISLTGKKDFSNLDIEAVLIDITMKY